MYGALSYRQRSGSSEALHVILFYKDALTLTLSGLIRTSGLLQASYALKAFLRPQALILFYKDALTLTLTSLTFTSHPFLQGRVSRTEGILKASYALKAFLRPHIHLRPS